MDPADLYSALPTSTSIRLLCLQPGIDTEQVSCSLIVVPELSSTGNYLALNDCWGDANDTMMLSCDRTLIPVTRTLYAPLHRLRNQTQKRPVWPDEICINWKDGLERNQQVSMLQHIYSFASSVYI